MNWGLPESHPFASPKAQWSMVASLGWRWLVAGLIGSIFDMSVLSFFAAIVLYFLWLRRNFSAEYYAPYAEKNIRLIIWPVRLLFLSFCVVGLWAWLGKPQEPYFFAWSGFCFALFVETFFSIKYLTIQETEK